MLLINIFFGFGFIFFVGVLLFLIFFVLFCPLFFILLILFLDFLPALVFLLLCFGECGLLVSHSFSVLLGFE